MTEQPPEWQLPAGVPRGVWSYAHSQQIVATYDQSLVDHAMFAVEAEVIDRHFTQTGVVADFGCGTGRALLPLVRRGFRGIAIDLSQQMLDVVAEKAARGGLSVECICANLVELDAVPAAVADYGLCLFSTLGMIQGRANRRRALAHMRRIVRPGGVLLLHAHNFGHNFLDPGGPWWAMGSIARSIAVGDVERGDRYFSFADVPNLFLHAFTRGELRRDLAATGFRAVQWVPLDYRRGGRLRWAWLGGWFRAGGWLVVCGGGRRAGDCHDPASASE